MGRSTLALLALVLLAAYANCKWVRLDPCDKRCECDFDLIRLASYIEFMSSLAVFHAIFAAHPDGSDIVWPIEVDDSNGTLRYRYPLGPPPFGIDLTNSSGNASNHFGDTDRRRRAAANWYSLWPGGIVPYVISPIFTGTNVRNVYVCYTGRGVRLSKSVVSRLLAHIAYEVSRLID